MGRASATAAYGQAERLVAQAISGQATTLSLKNFMQLTKLPSLDRLRALKSLDLRSTKITDLTPLANISTLETLNLRGTDVIDLRPLASLKSLKARLE
jgi:Leucine-rich repeat (LRR) protein